MLLELPETEKKNLAEWNAARISMYSSRFHWSLDHKHNIVQNASPFFYPYSSSTPKLIVAQHKTAKRVDSSVLL